MRAIKRVTGNKPCWKLTRCSLARSGKLRPPYGAIDFRAVRRGYCTTRSVLVAERRFGNRCGQRGCYPRLGAKLSPGASYIVTDLNQPMVDYAASRQGPDSRIKWRQADALALPFENAAFDLVCCQFGAMFFPDRLSAYREAKRFPGPEDIFYSTYGIASRRMYLRMM